MEIANVFTLECSDQMDHEGFRIRETGLGNRLGAELIGGSLYEVDPGKKLWPYHLHHANEESLIVLRGRPTLRTPEGERELVEGDAACFPRGATGAHQVRNETEEPVRILMLSTSIVPDIVEYPDSGKHYALSSKGEMIYQTRYGEPVAYWTASPSRLGRSSSQTRRRRTGQARASGERALEGGSVERPAVRRKDVLDR